MKEARIKESKQRYRVKNSQKISDYYKNWYQKNRKNVIKRVTEWNEVNKTPQHNEHVKDYYSATKKERKYETNKKFQQKNKALIYEWNEKWRKKNQEKINAYYRERRRKKDLHAKLTPIT